MAKNLFIIPLSALILAGCADNGEVTENMLMGEWDCNTVNTHLWYDRKGNLKDQDIKKYEYTLTFARTDDGFITRQYYDLHPDRFHFERFYERGYIHLEGDVELKTTKEYVFVSNTEFKVVEKEHMRVRETQKTTETIDIIESCIRTKN